VRGFVSVWEPGVRAKAPSWPNKRHNLFPSHFCFTVMTSWSLFWPAAIKKKDSKDLAPPSLWFCNYDKDGYILGWEDVSGRITICIPGIHERIPFQQDGIHNHADYSYPCGGALGDLIVVAFWKSSNGKLDLKAVVPIMSMTPVGPWWQEGERVGQVIAYHPEKKYQSQFYSSSDPDMKSSFQITLRRINEAQAIQQKIICRQTFSPFLDNYNPIPTACKAHPQNDHVQKTKKSTYPSLWWEKFLCSLLESTSFTYVHCVNYAKKPNKSLVEYVFFLFVSCTLGILLILTIWKLPSTCELYYPRLLTIVQYHLQWLESFPVGFKLNVPLTKQMSYAIMFALQYFPYYILFTSATIIVFVSVVLVLLVVFSRETLPAFSPLTSITLLLAVGLDLLQWITLPFVGISAALQLLYHHLLLLLRSLFLLLLSQKRNILRNYRQDTMEYDFMQLLVGTIIFVIGIFLVPTFFVYTIYTSLVFRFLFAVVPASMVWLLYIFLMACPTQELLRCFSERIDTDVMLTPLPITNNIHDKVTAYVIESTRPMSLACILSLAYKKHIQYFFSSIIGYRLLINLVFGKRMAIFSNWILMVPTFKQRE
jgi:hypothetical protein